jgi:hypothetical protein
MQRNANLATFSPQNVWQKWQSFNGGKVSTNTLECIISMFFFPTSLSWYSKGCQLCVLVVHITSFLYDSIILAWKKKVQHDLVRPTKWIPDQMCEVELDVWAKDEGVQTIQVCKWILKSTRFSFIWWGLNKRICYNRAKSSCCMSK